MATTINERRTKREEIRRLFDKWESMTNDELLDELRDCMLVNVVSKSRHSTIKWLVDFHLSRML